MFWKSRPKRVSPLSSRPPLLRAPGQSLEEQRDALMDTIMPWVVAPAVALAFAAFEWWLWFANSPRQPWLVFGVAVVVLLLSVYKAWPLLFLLRNVRLGLAGERAVAETLDQLKRDGYCVIHDIVQPGYNIDHVVLGPTGIYVIETKTRSKHEAHRDVHVTYDGQRVLVNGHAHDRDPIQQAQALADRVAELLEKAAGKRPFVRPVVVFPGWFVDPQPRGVAVWVLNDKALVEFVKNGDRVLDAPAIAKLAAALEAHARAVASSA